MSTEVLSVPSDLSKSEDLERLVAATIDRFGRCGVLANNAALSFLGNFIDVPSRRWRPVIAVNPLVPVDLIQAFLPGMIERGEGRIINFSSGAADTRARGTNGPGVEQLPYSATKAGIEAEALSFGLAHQLARAVSVNCVRPSVATEAVTFHSPPNSSTVHRGVGRVPKPTAEQWSGWPSSQRVHRQPPYPRT